MRTTVVSLIFAALLTTAAAAQHEDHHRHSSPYAGQPDSGIAALSVEEVEQLRAGAGMGMARAAELNRYPGPKHVLEMAQELALSATQETAVVAVYDQMHAAAVRLGAEIVDLEEHLQRRFTHHHIDEGSLRQATAEIARRYGELRLAHLSAHLETAALLTTEQIASYDRLRGYR